MSDLNIILPSKPRIISESDKDNKGIYEIEGLSPGYGQTLGNSLRRIILSSMAGVAITSVKIAGVTHEFATIPGLKEDGIALILNLKKIRFRLADEGPHTVTLKVKGAKEIKAGDIELPGQVEVMNPESYVGSLSGKDSSLEVEMTLEKGIGYLPKEAVKHDKAAEIGAITLDAAFTPIRRVSYEVENMRVGDRTDYNRLRLTIETDGIISPRESLDHSIRIMINQLKAIVGFKEEMVEETTSTSETKRGRSEESGEEGESTDEELLKTRIEQLDLGARTVKALGNAGIRTLGGLARKRLADLEELEGLGEKSVEEIKKLLKSHDLSLKD